MRLALNSCPVFFFATEPIGNIDWLQTSNKLTGQQCQQLLPLAPGIPERDGPVENGMVEGGIRIRVKISLPLELTGLLIRSAQARLKFAVFENDQGFRIDLGG